MKSAEIVLLALGVAVFTASSLYWVASIALAVRWWLE